MPAGMGRKNPQRAYVSNSIFERTYGRANELSLSGDSFLVLLTYMYVMIENTWKMQKSCFFYQRLNPAPVEKLDSSLAKYTSRLDTSSGSRNPLNRA
jgi:hypothetical protein